MNHHKTPRNLRGGGSRRRGTGRITTEEAFQSEGTWDSPARFADDTQFESQGTRDSPPRSRIPDNPTIQRTELPPLSKERTPKKARNLQSNTPAPSRPPRAQLRYAKEKTPTPSKGRSADGKSQTEEAFPPPPRLYSDSEDSDYEKIPLPSRKTSGSDQKADIDEAVANPYGGKVAEFTLPEVTFSPGEFVSVQFIYDFWMSEIPTTLHRACTCFLDRFWMLIDRSSQEYYMGHSKEDHLYYVLVLASEHDTLTDQFTMYCRTLLGPKLDERDLDGIKKCPLDSSGYEKVFALPQFSSSATVNVLLKKLQQRTRTVGKLKRRMQDTTAELVRARGLVHSAIQPTPITVRGLPKVFLALDVEEFEFNHSILLEVGWTIFCPNSDAQRFRSINTGIPIDLTSNLNIVAPAGKPVPARTDRPLPPHVSSSQIVSKHFVLSENLAFANRKYVPDQRHNFAFGNTQVVGIDAVRRELQSDSNCRAKARQASPSRRRGTILDGSWSDDDEEDSEEFDCVWVFHEAHGDLKALERFNLVDNVEERIGSVLDTNVLYDGLQFEKDGIERTSHSQAKLSSLCDVFGIQFDVSWLHNAGNDARLTMEVFVNICTQGINARIRPDLKHKLASL
ncbi:hypothetical protein BJ742DRAFT_765500 [Cladochytrium replicatum]|nr:hypothetical protein BJ742DRAFT_765500 [Cladochytrium replicatum]